MLIRTTIALTMAITLGLASAALAARSGGTTRGFSKLGTGARATTGVNPALHPSLGGGKDMVMADGKCWMVVPKTGNWGWTDCPAARASAKHKPKG